MITTEIKTLEDREHCETQAEAVLTDTESGAKCELELWYDEESKEYLASIADLSVPSAFRGKGIEKSLIEAARTFCTNEWKADDLSVTGCFFSKVWS